jgi:hypothetical protein
VLLQSCVIWIHRQQCNPQLFGGKNSATQIAALLLQGGVFGTG